MSKQSRQSKPVDDENRQHNRTEKMTVDDSRKRGRHHVTRAESAHIRHNQGSGHS